jgi:hypothetical protein
MRGILPKIWIKKYFNILSVSSFFFINLMKNIELISNNIHINRRFELEIVIIDDKITVVRDIIFIYKEGSFFVL